MTSLLLIVFVAFVAIALSQLLRRFVRTMHVTITDAMSGKAVHVESSLGGFDLRPQAKLDPALSGMLVYPGATPIESQPREYDADARLFGREFHIRVATYWTSSPENVVWEFYRRELPDWREQPAADGRMLVQKTAKGTSSIRVHEERNRTLIETMVCLKPQTEAEAAVVGTSGTTTRFGMLR